MRCLQFFGVLSYTADVKVPTYLLLPDEEF